MSNSALLNYLLDNVFRGSNLYGRIKYVAEATVGDTVPMGSGESSITTTLAHVASAKAFIRYTETDATALTQLNTTSISDILDHLAGGSGNVQCIGPAAKSDILEFLN